MLSLVSVAIFTLILVCNIYIFATVTIDIAVDIIDITVIMDIVVTIAVIVDIVIMAIAGAI